MSGTPTAGYSGKPAWQKLGLHPQLRIRLCDAPADYATLTGIDPAVLHLVGPRSDFDLAHVFVTRAEDLADHLTALAQALPAAGALWVSWPKKTSGVPTDVTEQTVRVIALPLGLVDVKVCAIDTVWSGLKLVWRREHRAGKA